MMSNERLRTLNTESLKSFFNNAFNQTLATTLYLFNPTYLYRGRKNWDGVLKKEVDLFENVSELWAPPQNPDLSQGRCNAKGQSLFYCTNCSTAILWELNCQPGEKLTIGTYQCIQELYPIGIIGASKISLIDSRYAEIFGDHYNSFSEIGKLMHNYVDRLFQEKGSEYYNATNAITSIFLNDNSKQILPVGLNSADSMLGLIYSSVCTIMNIYNIVLQPEYAKTILKPLEFYRYTVLERPTEHQFVIKLTHVSSGVAANGDVVWAEKSPHIIERITDIPQ